MLHAKSGDGGWVIKMRSVCERMCEYFSDRNMLILYEQPLLNHEWNINKDDTKEKCRVPCALSAASLSLPLPYKIATRANVPHHKSMAAADDCY